MQFFLRAITLAAALTGLSSAAPTDEDLRGSPVIDARDPAVSSEINNPGHNYIYYCASASCAVRSTTGCAVSSLSYRWVILSLDTMKECDIGDSVQLTMAQDTGTGGPSNYYCNQAGGT
jgi:hypothetical protein